MNPIKLLAMQAGSAQKFGKVGHGTLAPEVDPHIAAAMAAGMKRDHWIACRWAWAQDYCLVNELRQRLYSESVLIAKREKWRQWENELESLVDLALIENAQIRTQAHDYPIKKTNDRFIYIGWSRSKWYRWAKRYAAIYDILQRWEGEGRRHLRRAQFDDI
jgi:hypothetical protein